MKLKCIPFNDRVRPSPVDHDALKQPLRIAGAAI
jgi:hypothetical protein